MQTPTPLPLEPEEVLFEGNPALFANVGSLLITVLTLGLAALWFWSQRASVHYRITTQRIVVEHGLLSKRTEHLDLYRVIDYVVERPFLQRLMGTGNLRLRTMDKSSPVLDIRGIKADVPALYERLRRATEVERARRGVRTVDNE
ncbi:MAG: PH domain-containing protein [Polyangiaceae bacterium]|nr:PH domain-containing protein [Polyangiaceae bacterium]